MKKTSVCLLTSALALAAVLAAQPTLKVLYAGGSQGAVPISIVEVSPGKFLGIMEISLGIFSITADGKYRNLYLFPPNGSGIAATPAPADPRSGGTSLWAR